MLISFLILYQNLIQMKGPMEHYVQWLSTGWLLPLNRTLKSWRCQCAPRFLCLLFIVQKLFVHHSPAFKTVLSQMYTHIPSTIVLLDSEHSRSFLLSDLNGFSAFSKDGDNSQRQLLSPRTRPLTWCTDMKDFWSGERTTAQIAYRRVTLSCDLIK